MERLRKTSRLRAAMTAASLLMTGVVVSGCGASAPTVAPGTIAVVAAENQYGDVAQQVGGAYVSVYSVVSNPDTDPHTYEVSPTVAGAVNQAQLVIANGLGYDDFIGKLEGAASEPQRRDINVQHLLGLPDTTSNPHLWYDPPTMPRVAAAIASDLSALQPSHAAYFQANAQRFDASLAPWTTALATLRSASPGAAVATTEPVADYLLSAAGVRTLTPPTLEAAVMNGIDPSPQDVAAETALITQHRVKALVYNDQVTDTLTQGFIAAAQQSNVAIVGVYETMPTGYTYSAWMTAETNALVQAIVNNKSTTTLSR